MGRTDVGWVERGCAIPAPAPESRVFSKPLADTEYSVKPNFAAFQFRSTQPTRLYKKHGWKPCPQGEVPAFPQHLFFDQ